MGPANVHRSHFPMELAHWRRSCRRLRAIRCVTLLLPDEKGGAPGGAKSNSSCSKVFLVQLGMLAKCVARPPSEVDFTCGFHASLSSGTRSKVLRVFAIS